MYYYIAEPVTTQSERRRLDEIKSILSQLGIAGEFAIASPARTVPEHLQLAFSKGFSTIVGIGTDALISTVAGCMLTYHYEKAVLGAIPFKPDQSLAKMIGASTLADFAQTLRARRTIDIDAVRFGQLEAIVSEAKISLSEPMEFKLSYQSVLAQGLFTELLIRPSGELEIGLSPKSNFTRFLNRLFNQQKPQQNSSTTKLQLSSWQFSTKETCSLKIGDQKIVDTPFEAKTYKKALKLIVKRANITPVKDLKV